jgi:hypothetical protein
MDSILQKLLRRGDGVAIERGRLVIRPASGLPIPEQWLIDNRLRLCREVMQAIGVDALEYVGYDTGHYVRSRTGGVAIQFVSVVTGEGAYSIFNADLTRARSAHGKPAGSPLPKGRFRVGKRSAFYKFWLTSGLPIRRLSDFHDYMGNLSEILFIGDMDGKRICAGTIRPVTLSSAEISALLPDSIPTRARQHPDKAPARLPDKELPPAHAQQGIAPNPTTGATNYGNTVIREQGYTGGPVSSLTVPKPLDEQSVDAWLEEYENA